MIALRIRELVLEGFPRAERYRIAEAAEIELRRLIEAHGLEPAPTPSNAPSISLGRHESSTAAGARIGQSIFISLGGKMP